jgi:hypothetical protein
MENYKKIIENIHFNSWNTQEKVSSETSFLLKLTKECCHNCLTWDNQSWPDRYYVQCAFPLNWGKLYPKDFKCNYYDGWEY